MVKSGQAVACTFTTRAASGAIMDADALPTATLHVNGAASGEVVTVTNIRTGVYRASVTLPALNAGDIVELLVAATVDGISDEAVVWSEVGDTVRLSDISAAVGDLPTAAENADAIWDELLSGHATAGTAGHYLTDAGAAADPMMNDPADYTSGQLGYLIGRLAGGRITVRGTTTPSGDMDEIVGGADYSATDGYSFDWTDADSELAWPALTNATVTWHGRSPDGQETTLAMTVVTPTGDKVVRLALTAAQTAALVALQTGVWTFTVWATLTSGRVRPLVTGTAQVTELVGP